MQNMPILLITSRDKNSTDLQKDKIQNQTSLHNVKNRSDMPQRKEQQNALTQAFSSRTRFNAVTII